MDDIKNRDDIKLLVTTFYSKVKESKEIGYFFNETISNWEEHLEKLTDFWESNLFFKAKYKGNPAIAHVKLDHNYHKAIQMEHFGFWINLWFETIDSLFEGENANRAKHNARKMASHLYLTIFESR